MTIAGEGRLAGRHLTILGLGYSAHAVARLALAEGAHVSATMRDATKAEALRREGIDILAPAQTGALALDAMDDTTDLLVSVPPGPEGCPAYELAAPALANAGRLGWIGYFSSTAVYGDCGGEWIDESRPPAPRSPDAKARLIAEDIWHEAARRRGAACDILRISGIYGPGRNHLAALRAGGLHVVDKPGQVFNRIHRDDIAGATLTAMLSLAAGERLINLADGNPCSSVDLLCGLAERLDLPPPVVVPYDPAALSPGMAGFFAESRRLRNDRMLALPGFVMRYPDWRAGYRAILAGE